MKHLLPYTDYSYSWIKSNLNLDILRPRTDVFPAF